MSFFSEMRDLVIELLGPGSDFGEPVTVTRSVSTYNSTTRKAVAGAPLVQALYGTFDPVGAAGDTLSPAMMGTGLTRAHERVVTLVPALTGGFEPGAADVVTGEGRSYVVEETAHVIKQGIPIVWVCGLKGS